MNFILGWNLTQAQYTTAAGGIGQRVVTLEKVFNMREGFTRLDDWLPDQCFDEPYWSRLPQYDGAHGLRKPLEKTITQTYATAMWDPETGVPTDGLLDEANLAWLKPEVAKIREMQPPMAPIFARSGVPASYRP